MRTLIFDFDGTICDSFLDSVQVMNELAPKFGYRVVPEAELEGLKDQSFAEFQKTLGLAAHKLPIVVHYGRKRMRERVAGLKPVRELPEVLEALRSSGVRLGILTSNSRENVDAFLRQHGIDAFDFVHGESSLFGKGRVLRKILAELGLEPRETAYVGDEARDIKAARVAGTAAVAVSWGFNSLRLLREAGPDAVLSHPRELLDYARAARGTETP